MRGFLAFLELEETIYLVRCTIICLGVQVKPWTPELNPHNFSKEPETSPQRLSAVLAMFLVGGCCDGTARVNECLLFHLAAISSLGVCVQKGETWGFFAAVGLFARIWVL